MVEINTLPVESPTLPSGKASKLPLRKVIPIYLILWGEAFNSSSMFAYVGYMVLQFGMSKSVGDDSYRYYAGLLASSFFFAQLLSSFIWGGLSDRFGRRIILLVGSTGSFLSSLAFGFSFSYPWALIARSLNGLLNGSVGVSKTYLGEICDSSNIVRAFSGIGLTWGFGSIVGSMLGGLLAQPAMKYPSVFPPTGLFGKFPFLLPNLICAIVTLISLILSYFFLTENERVKLIRVDSTDEELQFQQRDTENLLPKEEGGDMFLVDLNTEPVANPGFMGKLKLKLNQKWLLYKESPLLKERGPLLSCLCYALLGMFSTMFDDVFPLYAMTPRKDGGLNFGTDEIGIINAFSGFITLPIQLLLYPPLAGSTGLLATFRIGLCFLVPLFPLFPLTNLIKHPLPTDVGGYVYFWSILCIQHFLRQLGSQFTFSSVMTMISNSVQPESMGLVNGVGQSMVALTRSLAPITGASILDAGIRGGAPFPFNGYAVWFTMSLLCALTLGLSSLLPISLNTPRDEVLDAKFDYELHDMGVEKV